MFQLGEFLGPVSRVVTRGATRILWEQLGPQTVLLYWSTVAALRLFVVAVPQEGPLQADGEGSWPESTARREVLMVSDGIDRLWDSGPNDPYADTAIEPAQRAGAIGFTTYFPGFAH